MKAKFFAMLHDGVAGAIKSTLLFPFFLAAIYWFVSLGLAEWAGLPDPTARQIVLLAAVMAFLS